MKVPDYWIDYQDQYVNGWEFAHRCWEDEEPFDDDFFADHLERDDEREAYAAGYYDFWKSKGVE
jgi:hypothetical protein